MIIIIMIITWIWDVLRSFHSCGISTMPASFVSSYVSLM